MALTALPENMGEKTYRAHPQTPASDGQVIQQASLERPQLPLENGKPTHLFAATCDGPGDLKDMTRTWNAVIPLKKTS